MSIYEQMRDNVLFTLTEWCEMNNTTIDGELPRISRLEKYIVVVDIETECIKAIYKDVFSVPNVQFTSVRSYISRSRAVGPVMYCYAYELEFTLNTIRNAKAQQDTNILGPYYNYLASKQRRLEKQSTATKTRVSQVTMRDTLSEIRDVGNQIVKVNIDTMEVVDAYKSILEASIAYGLSEHTVKMDVSKGVVRDGTVLMSIKDYATYKLFVKETQD